MANRSRLRPPLWLLQEAYELGRWMHLTYAGGSTADCPPFVAPGADDGTEAETKAQAGADRSSWLGWPPRKQQMRQLLAELEAARSRETVAQATAAELEAAHEQGQHAADTLAFNEATTRRRLIDSRLVSAGWDVGADGASTESVGQEFDVDHQPTPTGKGKADYVLWGDNGKPLAVIEAKRTAIDAEAGRTQARCYADGLETGHRPAPRHLLHQRLRHLDLERRPGRAAPEALRLLLPGQPRIPASSSAPTRNR